METTQNAEPVAPADPQPGGEQSPGDLFRAAAERALDERASPMDRARMISELLKAVDEAQPLLTSTRRADVQHLRKSLTLAKVSEGTGLSISRVDQIAKGK
ncbi:hypothetical protein ACIQPP_05450 [Streptomyces violaceusniger]|uniref:hypothetical protein n=1 Tax=Streptomyces violaceusniger TaxID=68280 RepID=UPI00099835B2|nr:hypothetical protein [Streptomyces hygroscopicus]AQW55266.1 hypothetical protein SHXM_08729 [Streptomyces hygroscopicus]